ncbi:MAG: T9SS type A sorting domain-containing protein [Bacteroidales bacterium]|nr:T9SS type A sorting domain-containing protein [Bacteroidales bacterium]
MKKIIFRLEKCLFNIIFLMIICPYIYCQNSTIHGNTLNLHSKSTNKLLDSLICYNPDGSIRWRKVYSYNTSGNCTMLMTEYISEIDYFSYLNRWIMLYNDNDLCIEELYQIETDTSSHLWKNQERRLYQYNQMGDYTEKLFQKWSDKLNNWYDFEKYSYTYFLTDSMEIIHQQATNDTDGLITIHKYKYVYNTSKKIIEESYYSWSNDTWRLYHQEAYRYNVKRLLIEKLSKMYKYLYTYNEDNLLIKTLRQHINILTDSCKNDSLFLYVYNDEGKITEEVYKFWDVTENEWINIEKYTYDYSSNKSILSVTHFTWYQNLNSFKCLSICIYEYDSNDNILKMTRRSCDGELDIYNIYYYSNAQNIIKTRNLINEEIKIFPNPANTQINITSNQNIINNISIYDINGKLIQQNFIYNTNCFLDVNTLNKGMYFIIIKTENNNKFMKFIKL